MPKTGHLRPQGPALPRIRRDAHRFSGCSARLLCRFPSMKNAAILPCLGAALALCACIGDHDHAPTPTVEIVTPADGSTVTGPNVFIKLATTNFKFALAAKKASAAQHDEDHLAGHIHVYLDRPAGLDADAIKQLTKSDTVTLENVAAGAHYLIVQGAAASHADYDGMKDSVAFTVN